MRVRTFFVYLFPAVNPTGRYKACVNFINKTIQLNEPHACSLFLFHDYQRLMERQVPVLKGISCTSRTAYQCLFLSSSTFTSNNSPAPLGTVLGLPAAHFLLKKQQMCEIKTYLQDASSSETAWGRKPFRQGQKPLRPQRKNRQQIPRRKRQKTDRQNKAEASELMC